MAVGPQGVGLVVILNNFTLANHFAERGFRTVFRVVDTGHDPMPELTGNPTIDRQRGYDWFYNGKTAAGGVLWHRNRECRKDVILQVINEWQHPLDGPFTEGLIHAADDAGYRLVSFNDAVGSVPLFRMPDGTWDSPQWKQRTEALRLHIYYKDGSRRPTNRQHYVGYHGYGRVGNYPASDTDQRDWFAGRIFNLYTTTPYRPRLLFTEYGPFDAMFMGVERTLQDIQESERWLRQYDFVDGFAYWTLGVWNVTGSGCNAVVPAFRAWRGR